MKNMSNTIRRIPTTLLLLSGIVLLVGAVGTVGGSTIARVATLALVSVVFITGLSVFTANSGVMSFGHVSFMAIGAYSAALLTIPTQLKASLFSEMPEWLSFLLDVHTNFATAVVVSALLAMIFAVITAPIVARLSGLQAAIATLALLIVVHNVLSSWTAVTRGSSSMIGIPPQTTILGATGFAIVAICIGWGYQRSRSGLQLRASREDYWAATASGINVGRHRALAWVLSSLLCGGAGALYACFVTTFNVNGFFISTTFAFVVMIVLGGYLSLSGAVIGAILVSALQEFLRRLQDGQFTGAVLPPGVADLILAAFLLVVLIKAPGGIMGVRELSLRFRPRRQQLAREPIPVDSDSSELPIRP